MSKTKNDLDELMAAVERVRTRLRPDLPGDLLTQIVQEEADHFEDQVAARQAVRLLIDEHAPSGQEGD